MLKGAFPFPSRHRFAVPVEAALHCLAASFHRSSAPRSSQTMIIFQQLPGLQLAAGRGRQVQLLWYDCHSNLALQSWLLRLNLTGQRGKKKGGKCWRGMSASRRVSAAGDAKVQKTTQQPPHAFRLEGWTRSSPDLFLPSPWPGCQVRSRLFRRSLPTCACPQGVAQAASRLSCLCFPVLPDGGECAIRSNIGWGGLF